jgi:uncharacterized membrane protein YedE/YeeE
MKPIHTVLFCFLGVVFGFTLSRSGAADYTFIQEMFLFESIQLYGIIGSAVVFTAPCLYLLKRHGKTMAGEPLRFSAKPLHRGTVLGGILFGIGWSLTGMCPGPILVNIGEGKLYALAALAGTLLGTYLFGVLYLRLQPILCLPPIEQGPGDG